MPGGIETTPIDELTRLPLPVLTTSADFYFKGVPISANYHHHFHPLKSTELGYDDEGKKLARQSFERIEGAAVRYSRGQYVPKPLHNRYHSIFVGPELPADTHSKFTAVVLACAGVVPRLAIDLSDPEGYSEIELTDRQHEFIRRRIYFEGAALTLKKSKKNNIGNYLAEYALQNVDEDIISEKEIRKKVAQFLKPKSSAQRSEAGRFILNYAVGASVADLIPVQREAEKERMMKKSGKSLGEIVLKFFTQDRFPDYFNPLEDRLAVTYYNR